MPAHVSAFAVPVAFTDPAEPPITLRLRSAVLVDTYLAATPGEPLVLPDVLGGRWLCVVRTSTRARDTARAHVVAEIDERPVEDHPADPYAAEVVDAAPRIALSADHLARFGACLPCECDHRLPKGYPSYA